MSAYESGFKAQVMFVLDEKRQKLERWLSGLAIEADEFAAAARQAGAMKLAESFTRTAESLREAARAQRGEI